MRDLIPKLAALNPEAEVYVYGGGGEIGPFELESIEQLKPHWTYPERLVNTGNPATPSDTLIVLSE